MKVGEALDTRRSGPVLELPRADQPDEAGLADGNAGLVVAARRALTDRWPEFPDLSGSAVAVPPVTVLLTGNEAAFGPSPDGLEAAIGGLAVSNFAVTLVRNGLERGWSVGDRPLLENLAAGWTAVIAEVDRVLPFAATVAEDLETAFAWPVTASLVLSDATFLELPMAAAEDDLLTLALFGARHWEVQVPMAGEDLGLGRALTAIDEVLEGHAALVVPRGWPCIASPLDDPSAELRFHIGRRSGVDVAPESAVRQVARRALLLGRGRNGPVAEDSRWRWAAPGGVVLARAATTQLVAGGIGIGELARSGPAVVELLRGAEPPTARVLEVWTRDELAALILAGVVTAVADR